MFSGVILQNIRRQTGKIQLEAARIVTSSPKLVSHDNLYRETCWETLELNKHIMLD